MEVTSDTESPSPITTNWSPLAIANKLFSEDERAAPWHSLKRTLNVESSEERFGLRAKGMGKSGGARVVYIWRNDKFLVFLITVFPKNEKENLSMAEQNALKKRADSIFEAYGR